MTSAPITTAVSGGVFQNALLLGDACVALRPNGFMFCDTVGCHRTTGAGPLNTEAVRQQDIAVSPRWRAEFHE